MKNEFSINKLMWKQGTLIAFGELFLKSAGVKDLFQQRLINNLRKSFKGKIHSFRERIFIETKKPMNKIFGIAWYADCYCFSSLKELANYVSLKRGETFAIRVKRDREKIIKAIASKISNKVDLDKPDKEIFVEQRGDKWFLYFKKKKGLGGLPLGSSGKVLCLISGGIDSVPAAYLVAKRGAECIWLHFHSFPLVSNASIEKVEELGEVFKKYQPDLKIHNIAFQKAQLEIKAKSPTKYRVILYRRLMLRIAEKIAKKEGCDALITGESLGQVSSQTLANIKIIEEAVKIPILRPLIGFDKEEIIKLAKKIKVYDISIKPQEDCCTLFVPKHQTAQGDLKQVKEIEKKLDYDFSLI